MKRNGDNSDWVWAASNLSGEPFVSVLRKNSHEFEIWSALNLRNDLFTQFFFNNYFWKRFYHIIDLLVRFPFVVTILASLKILSLIRVYIGVQIFPLAEKLSIWKSPDRPFEMLPNRVASFHNKCIQIFWSISQFAAYNIFSSAFWLDELRRILNCIRKIIWLKSSVWIV